MTKPSRHLTSLLASACLACSTAAPVPARAAPSAEDVSRSFQALAQRVLPSVVSIRASGYQLGRRDAGGVQLTRQQSGGSGVIVGPDGFIVTNAHVIAGAQRIEVRVQRARPEGATSVLSPQTPWQPAELVGLDLETDLALLSIEARDLPTLPFADSEKLQPGQLLFAFGSPLGLDSSVTMGVVSATARQIEPESPMIYLQTDAAINPGSSGGALVTATGELAGINTLIATQGGGSDGVGFAAPSNIVSPVVDALRREGQRGSGAPGHGRRSIPEPPGSSRRAPFQLQRGSIAAGAPHSASIASAARRHKSSRHRSA